MYNDILHFWFDELTPAQWYKKDDALDAEIKRRFSGVHAQAASCELFDWRMAAKGRLAEIIILDQFSRNIFRDTPQAFMNDPLALALAQEALAVGADKAMSPIERSFLYLPFMHSESAEIHQVAVGLYRELGLAENLDFEIKHKNIIDRFGRYPHRNAILGRESTPEELEFLQQPGSSF
ncbi:MAG: DUF924 family protein [Cellvibrio sp.]|uniref:DUF924 family protein n=1 Tax=Cellvibrio sp. TaxID=1965322 RepID=UPI0031B2800F